MSQHTPGPWQLLEVGELGHLCPADENGVSILTVATEGDVDFAAVYEDADARLIAAAPELLEELEDLVAMIDPEGPLASHVKSAKAVIAKATQAAQQAAKQ